MMAPHKRSEELADALFGFKEVLLIGFFLDIGLSGKPTLEQLTIALILVLLLPLQAGLFFVLLSRFKLARALGLSRVLESRHLWRIWPHRLCCQCRQWMGRPRLGHGFGHGGIVCRSSCWRP